MIEPLPFPTTDATEWVRVFREANPDCNVDDDTLLGWFANAIEHGRGPDAVPDALALATPAVTEPDRTYAWRPDYGPDGLPETALPARVVVGANGAYWRDYGQHYSMCPVSDDNDPVEVRAVYVRAPAVTETDLRATEDVPDADGLDALFRALTAYHSGDVPVSDVIDAADNLKEQL